MAKKKTTLMIEESVYDQARIRAAQNRQSVSDFVAEAVASYVSKPSVAKKIVLPVCTAGGGLLLPKEVDFNSNVQLADYLDEVDGIEGYKTKW